MTDREPTECVICRVALGLGLDKVQKAKGLDCCIGCAQEIYEPTMDWILENTAQDAADYSRWASR